MPEEKYNMESRNRGLTKMGWRYILVQYCIVTETQQLNGICDHMTCPLWCRFNNQPHVIYWSITKDQHVACLITIAWFMWGAALDMWQVVQKKPVKTLTLYVETSVHITNGLWNKSNTRKKTKKTSWFFSHFADVCYYCIIWYRKQLKLLLSSKYTIMHCQLLHGQIRHLVWKKKGKKEMLWA